MSPADAPRGSRTSSAGPTGSGYAALLTVALAAVAGVLLALLGASVGPDTWLALVGGRWVAGHGIPHRDVLTLLAHGRTWRDQQWLAQLFMYLLDGAGGLVLVGIVNVALIVAGLAGAAIAAMRLGAAGRTVLRVLPVAAVIVAIAAEVRTQPYAYPFFVATFYLLCRDSRRPSRRVYWCLALLVPWANLHGSASLGAGLVALRGLTLLWERRRRPRAWPGPGALILGAPACLLATPYGPSIIGYYRVTLLSGSFRHLVAEWRPITAFPALAAVFLVLAAVVIWSFVRDPGRTTPWERCALLVLMAGGIIAMRSAIWFGLAALTLAPVSLPAGRARRPAVSRPALDRVLIAGALAAVALLLVRDAGRGSAALTRQYPEGALAAVRQAAESPRHGPVFADAKFADWLLWRLPALTGRVADDARFELLTVRQLQALSDLENLAGPRPLHEVSAYPLLVLDRVSQPRLVAALRRRAGTRTLYDGRGVAVLDRGATAARAAAGRLG